MGEPRSLSERWIRWVLARHRAILLIAALVTAVSGWLAAQLTVNADLRVLLPDDHPVVTSLEKIEESFGSTNSVNFIAKGGTKAQRHAFTDALEDALTDHPLLRDIEHGLPSKFFETHALYYLSSGEFEELDDLVQGWSHYEVCSRAPDTCVTDPDPTKKDDLRKFIRQKREEAFDRTGFVDRYERDGIDAEVMLVHPLHPANELEFAREVTDQLRAVGKDVFERPDQPWSDSGMTYNILGPYITKADEHQTILRDMLRSGIFGVVGVVVILLLLFRSQRAVLVLLVPLICGVVWSLGVTEIVLGRLNAMTSMISSVVMGMGIDAGIHFFSRVKRYRLELDDDAESIVAAFQELIAPLLVASSTTVGAFTVMASSEFPAFREFGIIAALGVALCLLSMITVLPSLAYLVGIKKLQPRRALNQHGPVTRLVLARPGLLGAVLAVVSVAAFFGARDVEFEYNARELQSDVARERTEGDAQLISDVFGKNIHAAVLISPTVEEARATLTHARAQRDARLAAGEDTYVAELFGVPDLLPAPGLDMATRHEEIELFSEDNAEILEELEEKAAANAKNPPKDEDYITPADVELLNRMLAAQPFTVEQLPHVLLNKLQADDGSWGLFAYPDFDVADMRDGLQFMRETETYLPEAADSIFVGETVVYAAMFELLQDEAPTVLGIAVGLIGVLVFWQLRSVPWTVMTLIPLGLSLWWMLGTMGAIGLKFTLFNLPILPAVLGIGVDNGVYLTTGIRRRPATDEGLGTALQETGSAILAATATTAMGFAAFMVAASAGVRGIGAVAVLGIVMAAATAILVLPTLASLVRRSR